MNEVWKDIEGYEGLYQVSNLGRVKALEKTWICGWNNVTRHQEEKILKVNPNTKGYPSVCLSKNSKTITYGIHILVARAFIPNPDNLPQVNHKDEDKTNNCADNLEWCTNKYNSNYGTRNQRIGKKLTNSNLSKPICQYTTEGELVKKWPSSMEVQRQLSFISRNIRSCCSGKHKTAYGYIWKYEN